jgi:hypothetical protein
LTVREGATLENAIADARNNDARRKAAGYDQTALDTAGKQGFGNGAFEDSEEETPEIIEEFFQTMDEAGGGVTTATKVKPSLKEKLESKITNLDIPPHISA